MTRLPWFLIAVAGFFVDFCINTAILVCTYPIWREFKYNRHPTGYWLHVYLWTAALSTIVVLAASVGSFVFARKRSNLSITMIQTVITFVVLSGLAVIADFSEPTPADSWPEILQQIAAKFFAELQSIKFSLIAASSMSIAAGVLMFFVRRSSGRHNQSPRSRSCL